MKKGLLFRVFVGVLGGVVLSYLITIVISLTVGDGNYYPCVRPINPRLPRIH